MGVLYIGKPAQWFTDRAKQHQYCVRTENDNNGFFVHAAHHHGVGGEEERRTGVELFKWDEAQFLDADRHWKRRKIKESLYINAHKAKQGSSLMNLEKGARVDPCCAGAHSMT